MKLNKKINKTMSGRDSGWFAQAKNRLASNPDALPNVLDKLAQKKDSPSVLERVAENPQTGPDTLEKLSGHGAPEVRSAVAENPHTPDATVKSLATDENPDVRYRLAENPETPVEVLKTLAEDDDNPYVVARAQDTLKTVRSISERADDMLLKENFVEAEALYRKLVSGLMELLGDKHQEVAAAMHKLAAVLASQGKNEEAVTIEQQADLIAAANQEPK